MSTLLLAFDKNPFDSKQMSRLKDALPAHYNIVCSREEDVVNTVIDDIEIIAGWSPRELLTRTPNLRWFQQWAAGASWLQDHPEIVGADFVLTNVSGVHAVPISEHIFAMILSLARIFPDAQQAANNRVWARLRQPGESREKPFDLDAGKMFELDGATMLLVGVGAIGSRTARLAQAFGMKVIGVRRRPELSNPHVDEMIGPDQLLAKIPEADVIVLTIPATKRTNKLLGPDEFTAMKSNCVLVNIGRGSTIDEVPLLKALQEDHIRAAALDVFANEPLPMNSPFWEQHNLLITSHYSGGTLRYHERAFEIFLDNVQRWFSKQPLRNIIDKVEGY